MPPLKLRFKVPSATAQRREDTPSSPELTPPPSSSSELSTPPPSSPELSPAPSTPSDEGFPFSTKGPLASSSSQDVPASSGPNKGKGRAGMLTRRQTQGEVATSPLSDLLPGLAGLDQELDGADATGERVSQAGSPRRSRSPSGSTSSRLAKVDPSLLPPGNSVASSSLKRRAPGGPEDLPDQPPSKRAAKGEAASKNVVLARLDPRSREFYDQERCFHCRLKGWPCVISNPNKVKCASCGSECSFSPSGDSARQLARLEGAYKVLQLALTKTPGDENFHEQVQASLRDLVRVSPRFGRLMMDGEVLDEGI